MISESFTAWLLGVSFVVVIPNMPNTLTDALLLLLVLLVAWLIRAVSKTLPAYFAEKGKNLATKEDLKQLTEIAERIRSDFSKVNTVHRVQFEAEFKSYQELWVAAQNVMASHIRWQSLTFDSTNADLLEFGKTQLAFTEAVVRSQPFIPEFVFSEFRTLEEIFVSVKSAHQTGVPKTNSSIVADRTAISEARQKCGAAIKKRLSEVLVI